MSETDDTDVLLLIPPDFFLVRSSEESSCSETARTVIPRTPPVRRSIAALHATVGSLEHRVASLELATSPRTRHSSFASGTLTPDRSGTIERSFTFPRRRKRKTLSRTRKSEESFTSRSGSLCEEFLPLSKAQEHRKRRSFIMDSELSSVASSPSKKTDKLMLNEIDDFLNKVDSYESPESKMKHFENDVKENERESIRLPSGRIVSQGVLDRYCSAKSSQQGHKSANIENGPNIQETHIAEKHLNTEARSSVRKLNFIEPIEVSSTPNTAVLTRGNTYPDLQRYHSNSTIEKASKGFERYNIPLLSTCETISNISSFSTPIRKYQGCGNDIDFKDKLQKDIKLLPNSVDTDLLSLSELWSENGGHKSDNAKLEEERLKREHCEVIIQDLQKKILSQQEKLAVAVKVDRAKDNAILKLREAWNRVTDSLERAELRHKGSLDKMNEEMERIKQGAAEAQKKTRHFESEMYKSLDLAHDYQDKCKMATREKERLEAEREKLLAEKAEILQKKEEDLVSLKSDYDSVVRLNKQLVDNLKNAEDDLEKEKSKMAEMNRLNEEATLIHQERDVLREKMKEERARCAMLENQLADARKSEKAQDTEIRNLRRLLEQQKEELKSYYQKQLEEAVLAKLTEFQQTLDTAEREMEREAREREGQIGDSCNKRIQRIEQQHRLEVDVLEEKHKEEIKLYRLQLAQSSEKISSLEAKVETWRRGRGKLAAQLHTIMESQWRQTLDILSGQASANNSHHTPFADYRATPTPDGNMLPLLTRKTHTDSSNNASDGLSDNEIQKYVKMLLSKPPELFDDIREPTASDRGDSHEEPTQDNGDKQKSKKPCVKPTWKP